MSQRSSTKSNQKIVLQNKLPQAKTSYQGSITQGMLNEKQGKSNPIQFGLSPQIQSPQTDKQSINGSGMQKNSEKQIHVKYSEFNFLTPHNFEGHQVLEKPFQEYQISAFVHLQSQRNSVDQHQQLILSDSMMMIKNQQYEEKEDLLNDSCTPFSKLIVQEKIKVTADVEQNERLSKQSKFNEQDELEMIEEEGIFARNPRVSLGFYNEKPNNLIERKKILQEGPLFDYNEAKINDISLQIFTLPPILEAKKTTLDFNDPIFKDTNGNEKLIYRNLKQYILHSEINSREQLHLTLYNSIFTKLTSFEQLVTFLVDEFVDCQTSQIICEEHFKQISNDIAKKTILATKEEIKEGCFDQVINQLNSLQNQSVKFCQRINQLISLCDQQVNEKKTNSVLTGSKCIQMKFKFQRTSRQILKNFQEILFNTDVQVHIREQLKHTYEYFTERKSHTQSANLILFVLSFPQKLNQIFDDMILIVTSIQVTMIKVYDSQIDDFRSIKRFYQNLQNSLNQLQLLFDFNEIKMPKYELKIKMTRNILNQVQLPYKQFFQHNDKVLLSFFKKLSKLKAKWQLLIQNIIKLSFQDESRYVFVQKLQTIAGRNFILFEYMGFRNSLIKNPRKFNYSLIVDRPMLLLQKIDELIKIENQVKAWSVVMDNLTEIYQVFKKFPLLEEKIQHYQSVRIRIRSHLICDNPEILRMHTLDSLHEFSGLVALLHEISSQIPIDENYSGLQNAGFQTYIDLPEQFIRLKEWILSELEQLTHHKAMIAKIALNTQEQKDGLASISTLKSKAKKIIEKINHRIEVNPEPIQIQQIWDKYRKGAEKEKQIVIIFDKDQEQAVYQVYVKFLLELFSDKELLEKPKRIIDTVEKCLGQISKIRDLPMLENKKKQELLHVYSDLSSCKQKYSIWEHICASKFLVDTQLLNDIVKSMQILTEGQTTEETSVNQSLIKMEKLQNMIKSHLTFFEVNQINPQCQIQKKTLQDSSKYLNLLANNFNTLIGMVEENKKEPNKNNIEKFMQDLGQSVNALFKDKDFSLGSQKDELIKCIKVYVNENISQSKNVEKGTEFSKMFEKMDQFLDEKLIAYLDKTLEIYKQIFKTDFYKQKEIHNPKFKMRQKNNISSYEEFNDCFQIKKNLQGCSQTINQFMANFASQKKALKPKELLDYQLQLANRIDYCNEILFTCNIFENMSQLAYKVSVELNDVLISTTKKWESFFQMNATKALLEIFQQQINDIQSLLKNVNEQKKSTSIKNSKKQFEMTKKIDSFCSDIQKLGDKIARIFSCTDKLIEGFQIITSGFSKYFDQIDVLSPNFFEIVNYWLAYYQGKKNNHLPNEICLFEDVSNEAQELIEQIKNFAPTIKGNLSLLINQIIKYIDTYQSYFNADFLQTLNYFENDFYSGDEKIQNFHQFSKDLLFTLNVSDNQKDTIRNALNSFYKKNKLSDAPLRRMNAFIKAVLLIQSDKRMAQQKKLNKIYNIEDIFKKMGEGLLEVWINMCQQLDECLTQYWQDLEKGELKDKSHYISKIEDQEYNLNDESLKQMTEKFVNLLLLDYDLSKVEV